MSTENKTNPRAENPSRQCVANDGRLDTQNELPTAQQLYSKGKLVTIQYYVCVTVGVNSLIY